MKVINPATEEIVDEIPSHLPQEIESRLAAAKTAFSSWRASSMENRSRLMANLATVLRRRRPELAALMTREMGKPIVNSEAEIDKCADACDYFSSHASKFLQSETIASDAGSSYVRFDPLGPILAIMPWNFPFWQVFRFAAPTLMAGNVALLKHAPNVPGCALAIEKAFIEAGFPPGVFTTLLIEDNTAAERLPSHPVIAAVTLTGSDRAGSAVASAAGKALKKTVMELGGSDPFIVLKDADIDAVAKTAAAARCINAGQSCIAAKRFIIDQTIAGRFEAAMSAAMAAMKVGDPTDRSTQIGPLARLDLLQNLQRQVDRSLQQGATLLTGGKRLPRKGFFFEPTVLSNVHPGMPAFDEETFGPVAAIVRASEIDHAIELANLSRYGLGASIWTRDLQLAQSLSGRIDAGNVFINGIVKSDSRLPFGGIKNSGWGRELSNIGIREFTNAKTVWIAK